MSKIQTTSWDAADHLKTKEDITSYLEATLEAGEPSLVVVALGAYYSFSRNVTDCA